MKFENTTVTGIENAIIGLRNIYAWRRGHKLTEWHAFCDWVETLPYFNEFLK